jgi:NTP pyrophosphatase (non-canonical NTP hydrolase)
VCTRHLPLSAPIVTFDDYQTAAARTVNVRLDAEDVLLDAAAGLAEEAGEVLAHVRKHRFQNRPLARAEVVDELGDALWCLAGVARALGVSLGDVAAGNLQKLAQRHPQVLTTPAEGQHPA